METETTVLFDHLNYQNKSNLSQKYVEEGKFSKNNEDICLVESDLDCLYNSIDKNLIPSIGISKGSTNKNEVCEDDQNQKMLSNVDKDDKLELNITSLQTSPHSAILHKGPSTSEKLHFQNYKNIQLIPSFTCKLDEKLRHLRTQRNNSINSCCCPNFQINYCNKYNVNCYSHTCSLSQDYKHNQLTCTRPQNFCNLNEDRCINHRISSHYKDKISCQSIHAIHQSTSSCSNNNQNIPLVKDFKAEPGNLNEQFFSNNVGCNQSYTLKQHPTPSYQSKSRDNFQSNNNNVHVKDIPLQNLIYVIECLNFCNLI